MKFIWIVSTAKTAFASGSNKAVDMEEGPKPDYQEDSAFSRDVRGTISRGG